MFDAVAAMTAILFLQLLLQQFCHVFTLYSVGVRRPRGAGRKSVILNKPLELKRTESTTKKLQEQFYQWVLSVRGEFR